MYSYLSICLFGGGAGLRLGALGVLDGFVNGQDQARGLVVVIVIIIIIIIIIVIVLVIVILIVIIIVIVIIMIIVIVLVIGTRPPLPH